ncbi:MAG: efflux RND transporter permease subunit [Chthoniobacterales bacterium]
MSLSEWSVNNRVAVNLLSLLVLVAGILAASTRLKMDLFPDVSTNIIQVQTLDPEASVPEEVERTITIPIEEEIASVQNVTRIRSFSADNISTIFIEVDAAITDVDPVLNELRQAVDKARPKLPAGIEPPVIQEFDIPFPLLTFTISYPPDYDPMKLRPSLERLRRKLQIISGVSQVLADGYDRRELWVEVDPFQLEAAGVSMEQVTEAVRRKSVNSVSGRIDARGGQRIVRLKEEVRSADDLKDIPIKTADGRILLLRDLANFKDTSEDPRTYGRADMQPSVTFNIVKKKGADAIQTALQCRRVFESEAKSMPPEVTTRVLSDSTRFIKTRISTVLQNGSQALLLVTILLLLTLNWRLAILVALGIPISFAGAFLVLYIGGYTINLLSLFGMIMALGMVVDDAIVIAENCYRYLQSGYSPREAAIRGTQEVIWPVIGSVSTTVAAFLPLIWAEGIIGKFLLIVPVVVISALMFSLVQAFVVLPSHIADFVRPGKSSKELAALPPARGLTKFGRAFVVTYRDMRDVVDALLKGIVHVYTHLLAMALRLRYLAAGIFAVILIAALAALGSGLVRFQLFATDFADVIFIKAEFPPDYSLKQTEDVMARLERRVAETLPKDDLSAIITRIGARFDPTNQFLEYGTNLALMSVDIDEENPQARRPTRIARDLRKLLSEFPEFVKVSVEVKEGGPPVGRAVNVEINGPNYEDLLAASHEIESRLKALPGVYNVGNDFPRGKTELQVDIDENRAAAAGLDIRSVANALQAGFFGLEADRMRWGNEEVILRVKMAEKDAQDPEMLHGFRFVNKDGELVDLSSFASVREASGISRIKRVNQERVVTAFADVETAVTTSQAVNKEIQSWIPEILAEHPDCLISLTGENEDTERSLDSMIFAGVVALLLIYGLLAVITNSFLQPVVIMSVIPFGIVGVVMGLLFMGEPIGLMALMGIIALAGIVVNNSVVFVDFINQYRRQWKKKQGEQNAIYTSSVRWRSVMASAQTRFRPVFLTTVTTVAGLSNLAFASTGQEEFLAPMAQAIIFGLSFASLITMILIPCLYSILDDFIRLLGRIFK